MPNLGFKTSKPGQNVLTCDDEDLVFSSGFDNLIRKSTGVTVTSGSNITVAHGLAYTPFFFGLFSRDNARFKMGYGGVDATNVLLEDLATPTYWRYYIFYHTGA